MSYVIAFLEGIITFISPCLLPMLPIYVSYFAGGGERSIRRTLTGALGLGIPFILSALLIDYLKSAFQWIKAHYRAINMVSGTLLVLIGVLMATGTLGQLMNLLS